MLQHWFLRIETKYIGDQQETTPVLVLEIFISRLLIGLWLFHECPFVLSSDSCVSHDLETAGAAVQELRGSSSLNHCKSVHRKKPAPQQLQFTH